MTRYSPAQHPDEWAAFLAVIRYHACRSYLEIGARFGGTLRSVGDAVPAPSRLVAIDLPGGPWGTESSRPALEGAVTALRAAGHNARAIFGDSHDLATRERLGSERFDAVLLDGDHRYDGVARDFALYGPLADRLVAFHDIVGDGQADAKGLPVEVPRLWGEIKAARPERTFEIVAPGSRMGIGILLTEAP